MPNQVDRWPDGLTALGDVAILAPLLPGGHGNGEPLG